LQRAYAVRLFVITRSRTKMIIAFPLVVLQIAICFNLTFQLKRPVQTPAKLHRAARVMALPGICCVDLGATSFRHLPWLAQEFPKSGIH
jgi:hypothetical protein